MWFSTSNLQNIFACGAMAGAISLAGCGNTCVMGSVNNGSGSGTVKVGNPPPSCSLTPIPAVVNAIVVKAPTCEQCTAASRVKNAFVTVRGIQLRTNGWSGTDSENWVEIAPKLGNEPRQIDLMGDSAEQVLVENAAVPAGMYRQVRLQFDGDSTANAEESLDESSCGRTRSNCVVMTDGHVAPLALPSDPHELLLRIQSSEGESTMFLSGSRIELRLTLAPREVLDFSSTTKGLRLERVLAGHAAIVQQSPADGESSGDKM